MRKKLLMTLGVVLVLVGAFVALRPLIWPGRSVTGSRLLDIGFAAFFLIRGMMNIRVAQRAGAGPPPPPTDR